MIRAVGDVKHNKKGIPEICAEGCSSDMILARVVRQFETAAGVAVALEQDFMFSDTPTMGTRLDLANVPEPLEVVSVTMRPRAKTGVPAPPSIECFTTWEPAGRLESARQAGWRDRTSPEHREPR